MAEPRGRKRKLRLNQKLTLVMFLVELVPVLLLALFWFDNMQSVIVEEKIKAMETSLLRAQGRVEKAVELCNLTTQFFRSNPSLIAFLAAAKHGGDMSTQELIAFYRNDVGSFEKLVYTNPYLYQVRIYHPGEGVPEIMPVLYHQSRMERLSWAQGEWISGQWQLDYDDTIFSREVMQPTRHIMALVTAIEDYQAGSLGVLEVAARMEEVLPELYSGDGELPHALFADGQWYTGDGNDAFWRESEGTILAALDADQKMPQTLRLQLGREQALVSSVPLDAIGGQYVAVALLADLTAGLSSQRNLFLLGIAALLLALMFTLNLLTKAILRRFYLVMDTIGRVREGDLSVVVPDVGQDEVGELGRQLGRMLDRIRELMQENIDRELLAKNAQLKALQSQINAHFIYNVLESIKMMAEVEERYDIADALTSLGKLLRYSMHWSSPDATVTEELENVRNYLVLINLRFDYRIELHTQIPEAFLAAKIPKMTLQPIVENAVIHGLEEMTEDTGISIRAWQDDPSAVFLEISDRGRGIAPRELAVLQRYLQDEVDAGGDAAPAGRVGIGLKNVRDRIRMAYGQGYGMQVDSRPGEYTRVTLRIPNKEVTPNSHENSVGG